MKSRLGERVGKFVEYHCNGLIQKLEHGTYRAIAKFDGETRKAYIYHAPYGMSYPESQAQIQHILVNRGVSIRGRELFQSFLKGELLQRERVKNPQFEWGDRLLDISWKDLMQFAQSYPQAYRDTANAFGKPYYRLNDKGEFVTGKEL